MPKDAGQVSNCPPRSKGVTSPVGEKPSLRDTLSAAYDSAIPGEVMPMAQMAAAGSPGAMPAAAPGAPQAVNDPSKLAWLQMLAQALAGMK